MPSESTLFEKHGLKDNGSDSEDHSNSTDYRDSVTTSSQIGVMTAIHSACSLTESPKSEKTECHSVSSQDKDFVTYSLPEGSV